MADQSPFWSPSRWVSPDPGRTICFWVAGFLRVGIGLSLLTTGLEAYFIQKTSFNSTQGMIQGLGDWTIAIDPLLASLPYLAIGLGVALIVGFLTTASSIIAAFYSLIGVITVLIAVLCSRAQVTSYNPIGVTISPYANMVMSMSMVNLIPYAALIWLSPIENHPISVDALIFGQPREPVIFATNRPEVETAELEPDTKILPGGDHSSG